MDEIYPIISHNSYLINLATKEQDKLTNSYNAMLDELVKTEQLGIEYVNMHPGNKNENESDDGALIRIANELNKLMEDTKNSKVIILLETTAGQGNDVGYKFEHMRKIIDNINNKKRIGVTFDTCHSFGAGYDFTTKSKYENMIDEFDDIMFGTDMDQTVYKNFIISKQTYILGKQQFKFII
ncbi:MAG: deoxyribonuclease IV [Candidatus Lokiarchaeota archaeon]